MSTARKLDNNTDPAELLQRNIDDVHFQFDDKEEAYRGCAKLKQAHDKCFTTWYQTHYIKDGAATSSGTKSNAELAESMKACSRETALYNKCLKAKLDALGLAHLNTNSLAKDDD